MQEERKEKKRQTYPDRATLTPESLTRLDGWLKEMRDHYKGIRISRTQLVNWLITHRPPELSRDEKADLQRAFHDDELLAAWVLRDLRGRRARGETVTYFDVLSEATKGLAPNPSAPRPKSLPKKNSKEEIPTESLNFVDPPKDGI